MSKKDATDVLPLDNHLCFSIYGANLALQRTYKPVLDRLGITYPQYLALSLLWERDQRTVGEMARELDLEASTMTPLLKRLESTGFIRRTRHPDNDRQVVILLTPKGKRARTTARCLIEALQENSELSLAQINEFNGKVKAFRNALREALEGGD